MSQIFASLLFQGTKNVFWYAGGNLIYVIPPYTIYYASNAIGGIPRGIYNWFYPPSTAPSAAPSAEDISEKLIEELREVNKHLIELREAGVILVNKDGSSKDIIINEIITYDPEPITTFSFNEPVAL